MVSLGCDNARVNVGTENGIGAYLQKNHCPYLRVYGCSAHLFNLVTKHSYDEYCTLEQYDILIKKIYKFFSKSPKRLLDLERWFCLKSKKYHKLLDIYDIRWLSRFDCVTNYRMNLPAVLDVLLKMSKDESLDKKCREKSRALYKKATSFENMYLTFTLSDIFGLCKRVCKAFQSDNLPIYNIKEIIDQLLVCLKDAYNPVNPDIKGQFYLEFEVLFEEITHKKSRLYKDHHEAFELWESKQDIEFLRKKMLKVIKGFASTIIENLEKYFPSSDFIKETKIFDIKDFLKNYEGKSDSTYSFGLKEIYNFCEFYGEAKKFKSEYKQSLINSQLIKEEWPYFKLMLVNNFEYGKDKEKDSYLEVFKNHSEGFQEILSLMKLILLIPTNSACCERGTSFLLYHLII